MINTIHTYSLPNYLPHYHEITYALSLSNQTYITDTYGSSPTVSVIRNKLLLIGGGPADLTLDVQYATSRAYLAIPGIVMCMIFLVTWPFFCICRCCGKCGGRESDFKRTGYTARQIWLLFASCIVVSLGSCGMAGLGIWANQQLDKNVSGSSGITGHITSTFDSATQFVSNMTADLNAILQQSKNVTNVVPVQLETINSTINTDTTIVFKQVDAMANTFNHTQITITLDLNDGFQVYTLNNGSYIMYNSSTAQYPCSQCDTIGTTTSTLGNNVHSIIDPVVSNLDNTMNTIETQLVNTFNNSIAPQIHSVIKTDLIDVQNQITSYQSQAQPYQSDVDRYEVYRHWALVAIFALPMLSCALLIGSTVGKYRGLFTVTIHVVWLTLILTWLMFALHLVFLRVNADGCAYIDNEQLNVDTLVSGQGGAVIASCLLDTPVVDALNLRSQLDFSNLIVFPPLNITNTSTLSNLQPLQTLQNESNALSVASFGLNATSEQSLLIAINNLTNTGHPPNGGNISLTDQYTTVYGTAMYIENLGDSTASLGYCKYCTSDKLCKELSGQKYGEAHPGGPWNAAAYSTWTGNTTAQTETQPPVSANRNSIDMACSDPAQYNPCMCLLSTQRMEILNLIAAIQQSNKTINNIQNQTNTLVNDINTLQSNLTDVIDTQYALLQQDTIPVITAAKQVVNDASCGWLGIDYKQLKSNICGTHDGGGSGGILVAVGWITVSLFCIGICQIAVLICTIILQKRIKHGINDCMTSDGYDPYTDTSSPTQGSPQYYLAPDQSPLSDQMMPPQNVDSYYVAPNDSISPSNHQQPLLMNEYNSPQFHNEEPSPSDQQLGEVSPLQYY